MKTFDGFIISAICIFLLTGCAIVKHLNPPESTIGLSKKEIVVRQGIPHKELQVAGFDVLQYRTWCGRGWRSFYCRLDEYYLENGKVIKQLQRDEYYDKKDLADINVDIRDGRSVPAK